MTVHTRLALVGEYQEGKSTLVNALLGYPAAPVGQGLPTTERVQEYPLPGSDCCLLDTPGWNAPVLPGAGAPSAAEAPRDVAGADALLLLLSKQVTPAQVNELRRLLPRADGSQRLLLLCVNDRGGNTGLMARESVSRLQLAGILPLLFGEKVPVLEWNREKATMCDNEGLRRLRYLLRKCSGSELSPLTRLCMLLKKWQEWDDDWEPTMKKLSGLSARVGKHLHGRRTVGVSNISPEKWFRSIVHDCLAWYE